MNSILLTLISILALFYQALTVNEISLMGYVPNIIIPILIFDHFYLKLNHHTILFFLIGLALDCSNPHMFGTITISFMIISYLVTTIRDHLDLQIFANKLVLISAINGVFYLIQSFFISITYQQKFFSLFISFLVSLVINTVLSIIIISALDFIRMLKLDLTNE